MIHSQIAFALLKTLLNRPTHSGNLIECIYGSICRGIAKSIFDTTISKTPDVKLYLVTIKDIFHKRIVGWALAPHMRAELCTEALQKAVMRYRPPKGLIHHSNQGSQYCSKEYIEELEKYGMVRSMSRKGNYWENACAETFFNTIKSERLHHRVYKNIEKALPGGPWNKCEENGRK